MNIFSLDDYKGRHLSLCKSDNEYGYRRQCIYFSVLFMRVNGLGLLIIRMK